MISGGNLIIVPQLSSIIKRMYIHCITRVSDKMIDKITKYEEPLQINR